MIEHKDIVVTGGAGSIGSELVRQLAPYNRVCVLDTNETELFNLTEELTLKGLDVYGVLGDVRDMRAFERTRERHEPAFLFHAAALKHVTPSVWAPEEYVRTNILGTLNAISFCRAYGIKLANISTDKAVKPASIMGATKLVAEIAVRNAGGVSVRFGNVLGSRGSVLEIWQRQMERGEPLTVTNDRMERYMMTIPEAVRLVIRAAEIGQPGQVFVLDMGERVNLLSLAEKLLRESGKNVGVKMIGARPGEALTETLMSEEEYGRARKFEDFWVIDPREGGEIPNDKENSKEIKPWGRISSSISPSRPDESSYDA